MHTLETQVENLAQCYSNTVGTAIKTTKFFDNSFGKFFYKFTTTFDETELKIP